jgi:hypothetical protein
VRYNGGGVVACLFGRDQESIHDMVLKSVDVLGCKVAAMLWVRVFAGSIDFRRREVFVSLTCVADLG